MGPQQNSVVNKLVELCAQMGYAAANSGGVAAQIRIVEKVARASVNLGPHLHPQSQLQLHQVVVTMEISVDSLALLSSIKCLNTETMDAVRDMDSTPTMLSLLLLALSMALAPPVMMPHARGKSLLSWLKLLMKPQEDGQMHQMVHMHGDIVLSTKITRQFIVMVGIGHVLLVKNIMAEDQSNLHTTTITVKLVKPSN